MICEYLDEYVCRQANVRHADGAVVRGHDGPSMEVKVEATLKIGEARRVASSSRWWLYDLPNICVVFVALIL